MTADRSPGKNSPDKNSRGSNRQTAPTPRSPSSPREFTFQALWSIPIDWFTRSR